MASIVSQATLVMLLAVAVSHAAEQPYPTKPVRIIASAVGTTSDLLSRQLAQRLTESWGRTVIVDNRAGAATGANVRATIGATPDGYTFVMGETNNLAIGPVVYDKPPYDPLKDLTPVILVVRVPILLLTHPSLPVSNLREFIAHASQRPGKLSFGSASAGGLGHLIHAMLTQSSGVDILHVPYKGAAAAMLAVMSGEAQISTGAASTAMAQMKAGKVKALAVTSAKRSAVLPDVPTTAESGFPGIEAVIWFALAAPARTPAAIVSKVNRDVASVLNTPDFRERLLSQAAETSPSTPGELAVLMRAEIAK